MKNPGEVKIADDEEVLFHIKVILAGDGAVGKSSLLRRYVFDEFSEEHKMTIGMDSYTNLTRVPGLGPVKIYTWDLAGQPQWSAVRESFYLGSHAMALVFDVGQPETIKHLPDWVSECRGKAPNIPVLVVASKIDLPHRVPVSKITKWAKDNGYDYIETSSKNDYNVEAMFEKLGTMGVNFVLKCR